MLNPGVTVGGVIVPPPLLTMLIVPYLFQALLKLPAGLLTPEALWVG